MEQPHFFLAVLGDLDLNAPDLTKIVRSKIISTTTQKRRHAKLAILIADYGVVGKIAGELAKECDWQVCLCPPHPDHKRSLAIARAWCGAVCNCDAVLFFVGRSLPSELGEAIRLAKALRVPHRVIVVG